MAKNDTVFKVILDNMQIPEEKVTSITEKLGPIFLEELAKIDNRGDFKAEPLPTARAIGEGTTAGLIVRPWPPKQ